MPQKTSKKVKSTTKGKAMRGKAKVVSNTKSRWAGLLNKRSMFVVVILFAFIGSVTIILTHAASPNGTITGIANKCIDVRSNQRYDGSKTSLWTCNGTAAQNWTANSNSNGTVTFNIDANYCLDIASAGTAAGTLVRLWGCNGTVAQQWVVNANGTITNPHSGKCLDDQWAKTGDGNTIWLWDCNGTAAQKWNVPQAATGGNGSSGNNSSNGGSTGSTGGTGTQTGSSTCPLPAYPTPACTGVPSGTTFTKTVNGDYTAKPGETIDRWHIKGNLIIDSGAGSVTITNSLIDVGVTNTDSGTFFHISDSTIGPASGCLLNAGIGQGHYTADRVLIHNLSTGFQVSIHGDTYINDSYAQMCGRGPNDPANDGQTPGNDGTHSSGIQACAASNDCDTIILDHNTFDDRNDWHTTSVTIGLHGSQVKAFSLSNSLLIGGTYPFDIEWTSAATSNFIIYNNSVMNNSWDYAPASAEGTCAHQTWTGNKIVTMDANYNVTGTVRALPCIE